MGTYKLVISYLYITYKCLKWPKYTRPAQLRLGTYFWRLSFPPKMAGNQAREHPRSCRRSNRAQTNTPEPMLRSRRVVVRPGGSILKLFSCREFLPYIAFFSV